MIGAISDRHPCCVRAACAASCRVERPPRSHAGPACSHDHMSERTAAIICLVEWTAWSYDGPTARSSAHRPTAVIMGRARNHPSARRRRTVLRFAYWPLSFSLAY